jgi:tetratricopeptide (TPR) repeat protein
MRFATSSISLLIVSSLFLGGCPKQQKPTRFSEEQLATDPAANFVLGVESLQQSKQVGSKYAIAYSYFMKSVNLGAGAPAHFNAGWAAERLGQTEDAIRHYRSAFEMDTNYKDAMFSLAGLLSQSGKAAEATEIYRTYLETSPTDLDVRNDLMVALAGSGDTEAAMLEAQTILRRDPKNASVYRNMSGIYYSQGNLGMSLLCAEKALELNDGQPSIYNNRALTFLQQENEPKAIENLKTAIKLDSKNYEANMNLGFIALNSGDYQLAHTSFTSALETQDSSLDAMLGLAVANRGMKDYAAADKLYSQIISADPKKTVVYFNAAILHERYTRNFKQALKYLQAYVDSHAGQISPDDEVFDRIERVNKAQAAEAERKRQEDERKREEEERKRRNMELLGNMANLITDIETKISTQSQCFDPMFAEEVSMILEQAKMVVEMEDADLAADIQTMLDAYVPTVEDSITNCAPGGGDAAPAEGGGEAPAEGGGDEAPAAPPE